MSLHRPVLEQTMKDKYEKLDIGNKVIAEYIWLGGLAAETECGYPECLDPTDIRSKTRILDSKPGSIDDLPMWNFDGSSTMQAPGDDSEVFLKPVAMYKDPFRGGDNLLVMCECYTPQGEAIPSNTRAHAVEVMDKVADQKPWFGIEQEYTLLDLDGYPLGWPKSGFPGSQGPYYCGNGADRIFGRELCDAHLKACLYAGLKVSGTNAEVMMSQWEYQVGPCVGIESGDQMWVSRYIMQRLSEDYGFRVSFDVKPIPGEWNGAGCHTNFSTEPMRNEGGYEIIKECMAKLEAKHDEHVRVYGIGNDKRLTGACETAPITEFSWGVANRGCSVRIPRSTEADGKGYFEDRRPGSNIDPYVVTSILVETCCLD
eukprot:CAMPEP_0185846988 /NCGR_PEP_ID=MMETSP1354-20130828/2428_1 /TAXON_ID=708628 /ORGANISM="Erythrolobus madagascarensis, Strain CCMP3276" /LENGTH=370 /DNA_ID=CAMNT_0028547223 /DNA_START=168 /DNA_END=1280 /DNA_ORIENTATION=+